jgi:hypothetical protein
VVGDKSIIKVDNINLGNITKPASLLIKKISGAIGTVYRPHEIISLAKAEAEADVIKTKSQIEIAELKQRAFSRLAAEEAKKQNNMEQITGKALNLLDKRSKPQDVDDDWIINFFDKCRFISDEEMQLLWAKILAGEANSPGSYSKRTIILLNSLDKKDADLLSALCRFVWISGESYPLVLDLSAQIYSQNGINFSMLTHLDAIGLIRFDPANGFQFLRTSALPLVGWYYNNQPIVITSQNNNPIEIGKAIFTQTGRELSQVCTAEPIEAFFKYVFDYWSSKGLILIPPEKLPPNPYPKSK